MEGSSERAAPQLLQRLAGVEAPDQALLIVILILLNSCLSFARSSSSGPGGEAGAVGTGSENSFVSTRLKTSRCSVPWHTGHA